MEEDFKENIEPIQSYGDVDPAKQRSAIEIRLKEIAEMPMLDKDVTEERKKLETLLDNLNSNNEPKTY